MKKWMLMTAVLFCTMAGKGQDYRPLEEFGADTIAYLRYNFIDRKDQYIGQRFDKIVQDYELQPFRMSVQETSPWSPGSNGKTYVYGATLLYLYPSDIDSYRNAKQPYGVLRITFYPPHPQWEEVQALMPNPDDDRVWALRIGGFIVKDIKLRMEPGNNVIE